MGDRTNLQITVYDCPPEEVDAVLWLLEQYGLYEGTFECGTPKHEHLTLGESYGAWEADCGSSDRLATALAEEAPGASWEVWEDPKYEWLGSLNRYTPALGAWGSQCDADGQPVFTPDVILERIKNLGSDGITNIGELQKWLGEPWQQVLGEFGGNKNKQLARSPKCSECGEIINQSDPHAGHGMCASCLHDALRSGWMPPGE